MPLHPSAEAILPMFKELLQITPDSDPAVVRATMGVPTEHLPVAGLFHGFFSMHAFIEPAQAPWDRAVAMVRAATAAN